MSVSAAPTDRSLDAIRERTLWARSSTDGLIAELARDLDYLLARVARAEDAAMAGAGFLEAALPFLRESFAAMATGGARRDFRDRLEAWWTAR